MAGKTRNIMDGIPPERRFKDKVDPKAKGKECCRKFIRGACDLGDNCKNWHPDTGGKRICIAYQREEGCPNAGKCDYAHVYIGVEASRVLAKELRSKSPKPKSRCTFFFEKGDCKFGDQCKWSHDASGK